MATANSTRRLAGSSLSTQTDEFASLSRRLLVSINHVALASLNFGDLADLPPEHVPAGMTLHEAAKDLDRLYNELDAWHVRHEYTPKSPGTRTGLGVFTDDRPARTPLPGLPPALPCPFCSRHDDIMVSQIQDASHAEGPWFRATCGCCGVDAPGGETLLQAARGWNNRSHSVSLATATSEPIAEADSAAVEALPSIGSSDKTGDRIRAYLGSVRPLNGFAGDDHFHRGRSIIERMAMSARDEEDPSIVLSASHCRDVLHFIASVEPLEPTTWWSDPEDAPSHVVGFVFVLRTLERNHHGDSRS